MRAVYSPEELREAAAAAMVLHGADLEGFPLTPGHDAFNIMDARRDTDHRPGEDPLMSAYLPGRWSCSGVLLRGGSLSCLPFPLKTHLLPPPHTPPILADSALPFSARAVTLLSNMSWNAAPGTLNIDLKVTLVARVRHLGLSRDELPYLKLISGPRYSAEKDELRFSTNTHGSATANKRQVRLRTPPAVCLRFVCAEATKRERGLHPHATPHLHSLHPPPSPPTSSL